MSDHLFPEPEESLREISVLTAAHIGDAVFELMVRTWLYKRGAQTAKQLHGGAVALVSAKAQAAAAGRVLPDLDERELALYKRGRNARASAVPNSATHGEYHAATGIEALFGYLYLGGRTERLEELFRKVVEDL